MRHALYAFAAVGAILVLGMAGEASARGQVCGTFAGHLEVRIVHGDVSCATAAFVLDKFQRGVSRECANKPPCRRASPKGWRCKALYQVGVLEPGRIAKCTRRGRKLALVYTGRPIQS